MKQLITLLILMAFTFTLAAQEQKPSYIIRSGLVYKFNEDANSWSGPLEIPTELQPGDSIKSQGSFVLVIPTNLKNFFSTKYYTFESCSGARIPKDLRESTGNLKKSKQIYKAVQTNTIFQGDKLTELFKYIKNPLNVELVIYDSKTWKEVANGGSISSASGINIAIINSEKESVYAYLLWKDDEWKSYFNNCECIEISPLSAYEEKVTLSEPFGPQIAMLICSKRQQLSMSVTEIIEFFNNKNNKSHIIDSVDSLVCRFNLVK